MNTMQLSCFVEVAAQLSFSKAAEALHVSQPTVSHQIKALEDELGCALLVRSTRTVRPTHRRAAHTGHVSLEAPTAYSLLRTDYRAPTAQRAQQPYVTIRFPTKAHGARGVHSALTEHAADPASRSPPRRLHEHPTYQSRAR